jgi:hypothetical protein
MLDHAGPPEASGIHQLFPRLAVCMGQQAPTLPSGIAFSKWAVQKDQKVGNQWESNCLEILE